MTSCTSGAELSPSSRASLASAVGAFPMAKTSGPPSAMARSMAMAERVTPRSPASAATSASPMKVRTAPPRLPSTRLLMPAATIVVSVTTVAPAAKAATPWVTAFAVKRSVRA